ncbi:MAG: hypothetical protein GY800_08245 [Planctomycetes bacterium]|nr:hypothetical protein [Planctomycetota bacterium]
MAKHLLVIPLLVTVLSLNASFGVESSNEKEAAQKSDTTQKSSDKTTKKAPAGGRDFLKLAEPTIKEKKKSTTTPYSGGYWNSLYGGQIVGGESNEDEEEGVIKGPAFSPYYAEPVKPRKPQRPQVDTKHELTPLTPPPLAEFEVVEFAKLASGSYASEYADRFVKMRCRFASLAPKGMRLEQFPAPRYVNFLVTGPESTMFSMTFVAPGPKASKIFGLKSQKEINVYGRVVKLGLNQVTLVVEDVESVK